MAVNSYVDVIHSQGTVEETNITSYTVEVIRENNLPQETAKFVSTIEIVKESGTLLNIGAGPELPSSPYEGQIWVKT